MITINQNLSVDILSEDNNKFIRLPAYNTETLVPFTSSAEAQAFAEYFLVTYPHAWQPVPVEEVKPE